MTLDITTATRDEIFAISEAEADPRDTFARDWRRNYGRDLNGRWRSHAELAAIEADNAIPESLDDYNRRTTIKDIVATATVLCVIAGIVYAIAAIAR